MPMRYGSNSEKLSRRPSRGAIERVRAEAHCCLLGCFGGRETGSMITLVAALPEAVAAEAITVPEESTPPEAVAAEAVTVPEEAAPPETTATEAVVPESVTALGIAAPVSAMTTIADFRETLGPGPLEAVADRRRGEQRRLDG